MDNTAYVKEMVKDHEKDIAEFEKASGEVKDADLKKFIDDTLPVMKRHLEMVKKLEGTKDRTSERSLNHPGAKPRGRSPIAQQSAQPAGRCSA